MSNDRTAFLKARLDLFLLGFVNAFEGKEKAQHELKNLRKGIEAYPALSRITSTAKEGFKSSLSKSDFNDGKEAAINLLLSLIIDGKKIIQKPNPIIIKDISNLVDNNLKYISSVSTNSIHTNLWNHIDQNMETNAFKTIIGRVKELDYAFVSDSITTAIRTLTKNIGTNSSKVVKELNRNLSEKAKGGFFK